MSAATQTDWFAQNAPKQPQGGQDWFSQNAPKSTTSASPLEEGPVGRSWDYLKGEMRGIGQLGKGMVTGTAKTAADLGKFIISNPFQDVHKSPADKELVNDISGMASTFNPMTVIRHPEYLERGVQDPELFSQGIGIGATTISPFAKGLGIGPESAQKALDILRKAIDERRIAQGTSKLTSVARPSSANTEFHGDLETALPDIAEVQRETPLEAKGNERIREFAEKTRARADRVWQESHNPGIERHADAPINHQRLSSAGMRTLTDEARDASPEEARSAEKWIQESVNKPRTLKSADKFLRELNSDTKGSFNRYGPLMLRVKTMVADALRDEIDRTLEDSGERGVREANRRWGALKSIADTMERRANPAEVAEASGNNMPMTMRGAAVKTGLKVLGLGPSKPGTLLNRGLTALSKSSLRPEPPFTPAMRVPIGLLPGPGGTFTDLGIQAPGGPQTTMSPIELGPSEGIPSLSRIPGRSYRGPASLVTPPVGYSLRLPEEIAEETPHLTEPGKTIVRGKGGKMRRQYLGTSKR